MIAGVFLVLVGVSVTFAGIDFSERVTGVAIGLCGVALGIADVMGWQF